MVKWRRTPAIFAGLAGSAVWSVPVLAQAAPADEVLVTMNDLLASPVAYFFVGLGAGALVTGIVVGVAEHHSKKRLARQLDEERALNERLREAGLVIHVSSPGILLDIAQEGSAPESEAGEAPAGDTARLSRERLGSTADLGREAAAGAQGAPTVPPVRERVREQVPSLEEMPSFAAPVHVRRELEGRLPGFGGPFGGSVEPPASAPRAAKPQQEAGAAPAAASGEGGNPAATIAPERTQAPRAEAAPHAAKAQPERGERHNPEQDYEHIAEEYVKKTKAAERQSRASRGVRAILSERLHGNVMDGLPVIERADGSTADIGTSWWTKEVGSTHSFAALDPSTTADLPSVTEAPDPMSTSALRRAELIRAERNAQVAGFSGSVGTGGAEETGEPATHGSGEDGQNAGPEGDTARLDRTRRAAAIADRLSSVDMSLYPEERPSSTEAEVDMFEQALRAMDEQDAAVSVTTSRESEANRVPLTGEIKTGAVVSSASLAQSQSEHEVEEHVDYLVRDELERNRARHNQRTAHSILTVFDGTGDLSDARRGQHFAQPKQPEQGRGEEQA